MFKKIKRHMVGDRRSVAEEFDLSKESKFTDPSLEQRYWKNPNAERGEIAMCAYESAVVRAEMLFSEGI